ncbi:MAG: 2-phospho-L-lactate transferase [Solirubrobacterales bacterium]|nr:2-phospho-L-lactate transferase [Solirubrobacterales bacterium]
MKRVVCLAGGTGGAKLAAGLQEIAGEGLAVIANTADDTEVHGLLVCPDPDLITYWLTGQIDEQRGWGIRDDTFVVHERLEQLGAPGWFSLSDRDLATCLYRTHFLAEGGTLTGAQGQIARALGARARVLPMCEQRVRTRVRTPAGRRELQEFLILDHGEAPIEGVELDGIAEASPTPEVLEALAGAEAVIIGPSNPVISIGPILAVPGMREAIAAAPGPVVAVSPLVGGHAVKGPTDAFIAALGRPLSAAGVASLYEGLLGAMVVDAADPDPALDGIEVLSCPTLMEGPAGRRALADRVLELARSL